LVQVLRQLASDSGQVRKLGPRMCRFLSKSAWTKFDAEFDSRVGYLCAGLHNEWSSPLALDLRFKPFTAPL
jgi:hypothetical protein